MLTGEVFVQEGLISVDQLNLALAKQQELGQTVPIARILQDLGLITEVDRVRCLGTMWGIPFVSLAEALPDAEALAKISPAFARKFKILPLTLEEGRLTLAMANPMDVFVIDELRLNTGLEIEPKIAVEEDLVAALSLHYQGEAAISEAMAGVLKDFEGDMDLDIRPGEEDLTADQLREMGEEAPVIRMATLILSQAINDKASDIHIEPRKHELVVRFRIDGVMMDVMKLPKAMTAPLTSRFKIIANMDIAEKRAPQDARISARINGIEFDFRVSTLPMVHGEKIVLRVLDKRGTMLGLSKIGFLPHNLTGLEDLAGRSYGILLVTGPTGSGKSTTLYSLLNTTNDGLKNIITIEDPVEYEIDGINQCAVNNRAGMTFAAGLRAMLRQDPDVIMVGEMRDKETATIAMEAALTGHLVFSTLHTNDASSTPGRLMDMEVEPFLIASSIIGVLAQRLVRTICPKCREPYQGTRESLVRAGFPVPDDLEADITLFQGRGCPHCKGTGYKGRTGVHELLVMNDEIRDMVLRREPAHLIRKKAIESGMTTLQQDAVRKILMGQTTVDEAVRVLYA
ncbi:MAG: Flp pilus assembly complex ATPase component TadA [Fimbriimonadaceae bacterium]|nr:Flp pilus assembly complex ATPase component TadA [Fimbriimonadaceae bacterium]